jgi:hypothetical protein
MMNLAMQYSTGQTAFVKPFTVLTALPTPREFKETRTKMLKKQAVKERETLEFLKKLFCEQRDKVQEIKEEYEELDYQLAMVDGRRKILNSFDGEKLIGVTRVKTSTKAKELNDCLRKMSAKDKEELLKDLLK